MVLTITNIQGGPMKSEQLANELIQFFKSIPGVFDGLKKEIIKIITVTAKKAQQLNNDITKDEDTLLNTILDMIFILKKTPKFFRTPLKWVLVPVVKFLLSKLSKYWFAKVNGEMKNYQITSAGFKTIHPA